MLTTTNLINHFLLAMPSISDADFRRSLVLLCETTETGSIGLIINRLSEIRMADIFEQINLPMTDSDQANHPVLIGGPVKPDRGFVLHPTFERWSSSIQISKTLSITTSQDILAAIAQGKGPSDYLFILGYSAWTEKQLEDELMKGTWLTIPCDDSILFQTAIQSRYSASLKLLGIEESQLYSNYGHS